MEMGRWRPSASPGALPHSSLFLACRVHTAFCSMIFLSCMLVPFTCLFLLIALARLSVAHSIFCCATFFDSVTCSIMLHAFFFLLHYMQLSCLLHHSLHCLLSSLTPALYFGHTYFLSPSHSNIHPTAPSSPSLSLLLHQFHLCFCQTVLLICLACLPPSSLSHLFGAIALLIVCLFTHYINQLLGCCPTCLN